MLDYIGLGTNNDATSDSTGNKQTSSCGSSPEQNTEKSNASPGEQARKTETEDELHDVNPKINSKPMIKIEEEMDKMFNSNAI
jgi:hypothetical protein